MRQKPEKQPQTASQGTSQEVSGTIEHFRFRNAETGFAVVRFSPDTEGSDLTAVGTLAQLTEGQRVKLTGQIVDHPRFGLQI